MSLIKQQNVRYLKKTHKFGVEMPKMVQEALELDKKMATRFDKMPLQRK